MEEISNSIEKLKGIIKNIQSDEYKEIFSEITNVIEALGNKVEEIIINNETLEENVSFLNSDLSNIQEELFEEVSFEDLEEFEDEYVEINCKNCGKPLFTEKSFVNNNKIPCPFCNESAN
ncbi:MAG: CD1247 N-terminal domain-containing protein [Clostridium sp.]